MTPLSLCVNAFAVLGSSSVVVAVANEQDMVFDDECDANRPCALELLQLSHHKYSKKPRESFEPDPSSLAIEADATGEVIAETMRQAELFALYDEKVYPEIDEGIWTWDIPREIKVTTWSGNLWMGQHLLPKIAPNCHYNELPHGEEDITFFHGQKACCDWAYVIHDNQMDISEYDVVLFYLPYIMRTDWRTSLPATKKKGQLWIATCAEPMFREETFMDCRLVNDTDFMQHMDGFSSYNPASDFPAFMNTPSEQEMQLPPPNFADRGDELVTLVLSDCLNPERNFLVKGFIDEFAAQNRSNEILSYGKCYHNAEEPERDSCGEPLYSDCWANRCSSRPFKIVLENEKDPWYITEKIWDAFYEGAIPIYGGPTEAKRVVPPGSVIFAEDYASPAELARAIMNFSEEDIKKAHAWKSTPRSEWNEWSKARDNGMATLLPRICEAAARA